MKTILLLSALILAGCAPAFSPDDVKCYGTFQKSEPKEVWVVRALSDGHGFISFRKPFVSERCVYGNHLGPADPESLCGEAFEIEHKTMDIYTDAYQEIPCSQ